MLPLTIIGLILMIRARGCSALIILLVVPAYYLCFQSALHTEYRYVLAIHYFLFVLVAVTLCCATSYVWRGLLKIPLFQRLAHLPRLQSSEKSVTLTCFNPLSQTPF
jgi:hypothetical protein